MHKLNLTHAKASFVQTGIMLKVIVFYLYIATFWLLSLIVLYCISVIYHTKIKKKKRKENDWLMILPLII